MNVKKPYSNGRVKPSDATSQLLGFPWTFTYKWNGYELAPCNDVAYRDMKLATSSMRKYVNDLNKKAGA